MHRPNGLFFGSGYALRSSRPPETNRNRVAEVTHCRSGPCPRSNRRPVGDFKVAGMAGSYGVHPRFERKRFSWSEVHNYVFWMISGTETVYVPRG